jgi:ATP-dependent DNA helicase PIF1
LLGWNERAFQVHPEILGKDELFQAQSEEAVKAFSKIPEGELAKMHRNFLLASGGVIDTNTRVPGEKAKKPDTKMITLGFWKEGKTTSEIAKARNLKDQTIFDHIEKLVAIGEITKEELRRLVSATLAKDLPTIHGLFKKLETHALTPLFEQFGQKYSYDELRLARMLLDDGFDF